METTKTALANALMALLQSKSFDEITVKQIVIESDVNRQTFYYHFQDKFSCLQFLFYEQARVLIPEKITVAEWKSFYLSVFQYLDINHTFCWHVEVSAGYPQLADFVLDCIDRIVQEISKSFLDQNMHMRPGKDLSVFEYGLQGVVMNWFRDGLRENPELLINGAANFTEWQLQILLFCKDDQVDRHLHTNV